jgi:hypothetical protein
MSTITAASAKTLTEARTTLSMELLRANRDAELAGPDDEFDFRFWWHSDPSLTTRKLGITDESIQTLCKNLNATQCAALLGAVSNRQDGQSSCITLSENRVRSISTRQAAGTFVEVSGPRSLLVKRTDVAQGPPGGQGIDYIGE